MSDKGGIVQPPKLTDEQMERVTKAIEQGEAEIASGKPIPTLDEVIEQSGRGQK